MHQPSGYGVGVGGSISQKGGIRRLRTRREVFKFFEETQHNLNRSMYVHVTDPRLHKISSIQLVGCGLVRNFFK